MNYLFLTQSRTLSVFHNIAHMLHQSDDSHKIGYYIADSAFYHAFQKSSPEINSERYLVLKEWDIITRSRAQKLNIAKLREYEMRYGDPYLWNAIVADRRIYLGRHATREQDYASRWNHDEMLCMLQAGIEALEDFFERLQPDVAVGFICVSIGEYLSYLICKHIGIPFINLRPTRIQNYFYGGESVLEPSDRLIKRFHHLADKGIPEPKRQQAYAYIENVRSTTAMYEGVIPANQSDKVNITEKASNRWNLSTKIKNTREKIDLAIQHRFGHYQNDNSYRGILYPTWHSRFLRPMRTAWVNIRLKRSYRRASQLRTFPYALFPLHKEPEVTLLVYGKPFLNQIEVVRLIARSLPVGMKLAVKEHPAAVGYRPCGYYRKLLSIPNVVLIAPDTTSREALEHARLVTVIGGSMGLEAIMRKKPLIVFGRVPFSGFPETMVCYIQELDRTGEKIAKLVENHHHEDHVLAAYVSAVMEMSVPVDFYSVLLKREGVYRSDNQTNIDSDIFYQHINRLGDYIRRRAVELNHVKFD